MPRKSIDHDLYRGTLDIIVLSLLKRRPDHGYGLAERLRGHSAGRMDVSEGAIYPLLHRMEKRGLISSEWSYTVNHRRAKQYTVTEAGASVLSERTAQWRSLAQLVDDLVDSIRPDLGTQA